MLGCDETMRSWGRSGLRPNKRGINLRFDPVSGGGFSDGPLPDARRSNPETDSFRPWCPSLGLALESAPGVSVSRRARVGIVGTTGCSTGTSVLPEYRSNAFCLSRRYSSSLQFISYHYGIRTRCVPHAPQKSIGVGLSELI